VIIKAIIIIDELELEDEDPRNMIRDPSYLGVVRSYHEPESLDSSHHRCWSNGHDVSGYNLDNHGPRPLPD